MAATSCTLLCGGVGLDAAAALLPVPHPPVATGASAGEHRGGAAATSMGGSADVVPVAGAAPASHTAASSVASVGGGGSSALSASGSASSGSTGAVGCGAAAGGVAAAASAAAHRRNSAVALAAPTAHGAGCGGSGGGGGVTVTTTMAPRVTGLARVHPYHGDSTRSHRCGGAQSRRQCGGAPIVLRLLTNGPNPCVSARASVLHWVAVGAYGDCSLQTKIAVHTTGGPVAGQWRHRHFFQICALKSGTTSESESEFRIQN